jgi:hypothetical protein
MLETYNFIRWIKKRLMVCGKKNSVPFPAHWEALDDNRRVVLVEICFTFPIEDNPVIQMN